MHAHWQAPCQVSHRYGHVGTELEDFVGSHEEWCSDTKHAYGGLQIHDECLDICVSAGMAGEATDLASSVVMKGPATMHRLLRPG